MVERCGGELGAKELALLLFAALEFIGGTDREIDAAFESLVQARTGALLVAGNNFFNSRIEQIVGLAARHAIPTMYGLPEFVVAGGLISYGMRNNLIEECGR